MEGIMGRIDKVISKLMNRDDNCYTIVRADMYEVLEEFYSKAYNQGYEDGQLHPSSLIMNWMHKFKKERSDCV